MTKRFHLFFTAVLIPLDALSLFAAAGLAYSLRFSGAFSAYRPVTFDLSFGRYMQISALIIAMMLLLFALSGLYRIRRERLITEGIRSLVAISAGMAIVLAIAFFSRDLFESRFIFVAAWVLAILFVALMRLLVRLTERSLHKYGIGLQHLVIIGKTKEGQELKKYFNRYPHLGYSVTHLYAHFNKATKDSIRHHKGNGRIDAIMVANPDIDRNELRAIKLFSDIEHIHFLYSTSLFPGSTTRPIFHTYAGQPVIEVPKTPLDGWGAIFKRVFDILGASALILVTLPIQLIAALAIVIESKGGIFFAKLPNGKKTMRVGQGGRSFHYFKFRSMQKDRHFERYDKLNHLNTREGALVKLKNDPRVTRVGRFIRRFSIDELPELYLVLAGKMSLVGPRPHLPEEVENYKPSQRRVLTVKPGITGLAQISGRADLSFDEEVRLDMHYIENWTPWMDLYILIRTPIVVFFRPGQH